jgi:hypothetical protein
MKPADIKDMVFYRGVSGHDRAIVRRYREMVRGEPVDSVDWQAWPDGVGSCLLTTFARWAVARAD